MLNRDYRHEMKPAIGAFGHSYHAFLRSKRSRWRWTVVLSVLFAALLYSVGVAMAQGSPPEIPDAPTATAIFLGGVDLEWNEVANAESYDLQWYDVGTGEWFDLPEGNIEVALYGAGAVVSGLDQNNSYFWVRASNENGSSDWSDYVGVPPTEQEPPLGRKRKPDNETPTGAPHDRRRGDRGQHSHCGHFGHSRRKWTGPCEILLPVAFQRWGHNHGPPGGDGI